MTPYAASSVPKPTASPARKIHIPSLPQLSGVSGDSAGSTAAPAGRSAARAEPPRPHPERDGGEPRQRAEHVRAVQPDQRVEGAAVGARRHEQSEVDQPDPLEALDGQEDSAERRRDTEPPGERRAV